jgi:predicted porin
VAGSTGSGQTWSAAAGYAVGGASFAAGFLHIDNGNPTLSARGTTSADSLFNSSVNAAYATASSVNIARASAQYVLGAVTAGIAYSYSQYAADAPSTFSGSQHYHNGSAFVGWMLAPDFRLVGGYNYTKSGGNASATYHQGNLGIDYLLSKRTDLYATAAYTHASGSNGAGNAQAVVGSWDIDSGRQSQVIAIVGMRHKFYARAIVVRPSVHSNQP